MSVYGQSIISKENSKTFPNFTLGSWVDWQPHQSYWGGRTLAPTQTRHTQSLMASNNKYIPTIWV